MTARNFNPPDGRGGPRHRGRGRGDRPPPRAIDPHMVHTPGIYVDRVVVGEHQEKVVERRKTRPSG